MPGVEGKARVPHLGLIYEAPFENVSRSFGLRGGGDFSRWLGLDFSLWTGSRRAGLLQARNKQAPSLQGNGGMVSVKAEAALTPLRDFYQGTHFRNTAASGGKVIGREFSRPMWRTGSELIPPMLPTLEPP
jgi:hypothetical protein